MSTTVWGDDSTHFFYSLSPEKILSTVEELGVRATGRIIPLNSLENRVLEVELEETSTDPSPRVVAKFYRPGRWSKEQIEEEHQFLFDLQKQDIPVVAPMRFPTGDSLTSVSGEQILAAIFPKQRGRNPDELDEQKLLRLGRLIAQVHNVGASRRAKYRLHLNPETYGLRNLDFLIDSEAIPEATAIRYEEVVEEICDRIAPLFELIPCQRIHGDCHFGNILWGDSGPFLVDFDDSVVGPPIQDLWLLAPGRDAESLKQLETLISGYEEMRKLDSRSLKLIEPLRALRFIHFSAWIQKRWDDPAFQKSYPMFGTDKYWREQLIDLEEILEML